MMREKERKKIAVLVGTDTGGISRSRTEFIRRLQQIVVMVHVQVVFLREGEVLGQPHDPKTRGRRSEGEP